MRACKKAQEFWSPAASRKSYKKTEFLIEIPRIRGGHFALKFQGAMVNHIRENSRPKCHILFTENRQLKRRFCLLTKYSLLNKIKTNKLRFLWVVKLRNFLPIDSRRINAVWKCRRALNFIFFAPSVVAKNRRNLIKNLESLRGLQNNLSRLRLLVLIRDSKFVLFKKPRYCFLCSRRVKISLSEPAEFLLE